jgi:hypothetical protein
MGYCGQLMDYWIIKIQRKLVDAGHMQYLGGGTVSPVNYKGVQPAKYGKLVQ